MPQSNHRKKGGGINEREPSAFIAYTYDSKTMPPCKMQSAKAKHKVLDEITGFARSRHPVKVHCYQWTTSNYKWRAMLPPGRSLAPACDCSLPLFPKAVLPVSKKRESIRPPSNSAIYERPFGMGAKVGERKNYVITKSLISLLLIVPYLQMFVK